VTSPAGYLLALLAFASTASAADEWLDRLDEKLTLSSPEGAVRVRLSGFADLEYYHLPRPAPALLETTRHDFFAPRLTLFLDAQLGPKVYLFAQARADRGFDPGDRGARVRLDEYALRLTPWDDGRLSVQVGKFPTVLGMWTQRHLSWDNPFVSAPLPYEHATGISDFEAPASVHELRHFPPSEKYDRLPLIWGPGYSTGLSVSGRVEKLEYAFEIKNTPPSSRPESWSATEIGFSHPTFSGRVGYRPNQAWNFGLSGSGGGYFRPEAQPELPRSRSHYWQYLIGQDVSYAWHHLQIWAEVYEARFEVPRIGNADSLGYFVEAKYKLTPQLYAALRWNQELFSTMRGQAGENGREAWGEDIWRLDAALGYRFTAHTQLKAQYSVQREEAASVAHIFAAQFTLKF
jgi:hypothetical protein